MAIRKVAVMGHPVLRTAAAPVPPKDIRTQAIQNLIRDMIETMYEYDGRGLAAPQIHESLQIVVMLWGTKKPEDSPEILCLINPEIKPLTGETQTFWEGCLSLPGLRGKVTRPKKISVNALSPLQEPIRMVVEGFDATVFQHEHDHLRGVLYIDRMDSLHDFSFTSEYEHYIAGSTSNIEVCENADRGL
jgi:peptide deformylase